MKNIFYLFATLLALSNSQNSNAQDSNSSKNNAIIDQNGNVRCSNGATISVTDLLANRGAKNPKFQYNSSLPSVCTDAVNEQINSMIDRFKKEDQANLQGIANNFCSHQSGWIEKVPGTCNAGGPPPICPVDHWRQVGRTESMKEFEKQNMKKAKERIMQLVRLNDNICGCTVNELKRQDRERWNNSNFNRPLSAFDAGMAAAKSETRKSSIRITCMGSCPPGYICKDGFCEENEETLERKALNVAVDKVKDMVQDKAKEEALQMLLERLGGIGGKFLKGLEFVEKYNIYIKAGEAFLDGPPDVKLQFGSSTFTTGKMYSENELYMKSLAKVSGSINHLTDLYNEIIRLNTGQNLVRNRSYIINDIAKERSELAQQLYLLNGYRSEVTWTCNGCCNQMLDYQHESAVDYANKILNVNIE